MSDDQAAPLAIIAPTYRRASQAAEDRGLDPGDIVGRTWFYVHSERRILGREPGRYVVVLAPEDRLTGEQMKAWDYMIMRGWRPVDES